MRRVIIPINLKLNVFLLCLLLASISFFVFYSIRLFESDKMAYVYQATQSQTQAIAQNFELRMESAGQMVEALAQVRFSTQALKDLFDSQNYLKGFVEYKEGKIIRQLMENDLQLPQLPGLLKELASLAPGEFVSHHSHQEIDYLIIGKNVGSSTLLGIFSSDFVLELVGQSRLFRMGLVDSSTGQWWRGQSLYQEQAQGLLRVQIEKIGMEQGVFATATDRNRWIVGYEKLKPSSLILVTLVEEAKALEASELLKHKSLFFGLFVLSAAIILGFLFSRLFTGPIEKLYQASREFAAKNFSSRANVKSKDELGMLADSFNSMADEIVLYMQQMEEKARLENELKTAQLVQKSFFEGESLQKGKYLIHSVYRPATECGGDWWGSLEWNGKLVLMVVDATGHGTAAALITAVIHNCLTALEYLAKLDERYQNSSAHIMQYLNQSVCNVKSDLMATAFVAIVDNSAGKIVYTNASHNPPLLLKGKSKTMQKDDLLPLLEQPGNRLGQDRSSQYQEVELSIAADARLLFYTDGLVEGTSPQGKAWGRRNLIKNILQNQSADMAKVVDSIMQEADQFYASMPQADDICVVGVEMK